MKHWVAVSFSEPPAKAARLVPADCPALARAVRDATWDSDAEESDARGVALEADELARVVLCARQRPGAELRMVRFDIELDDTELAAAPLVHVLHSVAPTAEIPDPPLRFVQRCSDCGAATAAVPTSIRSWRTFPDRAGSPFLFVADLLLARDDIARLLERHGVACEHHLAADGYVPVRVPQVTVDPSTLTCSDDQCPGCGRPRSIDVHAEPEALLGGGVLVDGTRRLRVSAVPGTIIAVSDVLIGAAEPHTQGMPRLLFLTGTVAAAIRQVVGSQVLVVNPIDLA